MFVKGACLSNVIQLETTDDPDPHPASLAGGRNKAKLGPRVNLAGWAEETGAVISAGEV